MSRMLLEEEHRPQHDWGQWGTGHKAGAGLSEPSTIFLKTLFFKRMWLLDICAFSWAHRMWIGRRGPAGSAHRLLKGSEFVLVRGNPRQEPHRSSLCHGWLGDNTAPEAAGELVIPWTQCLFLCYSLMSIIVSLQQAWLRNPKAKIVIMFNSRHQYRNSYNSYRVQPRWTYWSYSEYHGNIIIQSHEAEVFPIYGLHHATY